MTRTVPGAEVAARVNSAFAGSLTEETPDWITVQAGRLIEVARFLRDDPELDCKFLNSLTAVDRIDYFEIVYHLSSLARNHMLVLKTQADRNNPVVPSLIEVWQGADLQEREAFDLMGILFEGHPRMRRIFLWEGFPGHPLRKDYLSLPGGFRPGLNRFPFEFPQGQTPGYEHVPGELAAGKESAAKVEAAGTAPEGDEP